MVIEVLGTAGVVVGLYEYFTKKNFKAAVQVEVSILQAEVAALKTKAVTAVPVVESDFKKVETAILNVLSKF